MYTLYTNKYKSGKGSGHKYSEFRLGQNHHFKDSFSVSLVRCHDIRMFGCNSTLKILFGLIYTNFKNTLTTRKKI